MAEVVGVEMGEDGGVDVGDSDASAAQALGGDAGADAQVDEEDAGEAADRRAVAHGAGGEDGELEGHPCRCKG